MREILFRGKRVDNGEWVEGGYYVKKVGDYLTSAFIVENLTDEVNEAHRVIPETVGQYTGLTANGKKIFEGDIVDGYNACGEHYIKRGVVKWNDFFLEWGIDKSHSMYGDSSVSSYEVIGNIHDNPELLKGSESDA